MNKKNKEARKQARLEKLGTNNPICVVCGVVDDWRCLEEHHIAWQAHGDELAIVCRNCHRILSDDQKDHPKPISETRRMQSIGYLLIGLADLFSQLVISLRSHGEYLIHTARENSK
jgi:hypothetical protein